MNNLKRLKKLVLANKETRRLYRMMQFLAIFMVISCTIIVVVAKWIEHDQNQKREELSGSWDEVFLDVPAEDLNYFKQNAFLEQISIQSIQEKVFLEGDKRVVIGSCDDNFLEMGNIEVLEGRMPEKENEVAVEEEYLEILGVASIGDIISKESIIDVLKGFKVVGIIENYSKLWKMVNSEIKYINCFIINNNPDYGEKNVFTRYKQKDYFNGDIDINMMYYRYNAKKESIPIWKEIWTILTLGIFIELLLCLYVLGKVNKKYFGDTWFTLIKEQCFHKRKILSVRKVRIIIVCLFNIAIAFNNLKIIESFVDCSSTLDLINICYDIPFFQVYFIEYDRMEYLFLNSFSDNSSYIPVLYLSIIVRYLFQIVLSIYYLLVVLTFASVLINNNFYSHYNFDKMYLYYYNKQNYSLKMKKIKFKKRILLPLMMQLIITLLIVIKYGYIYPKTYLVKLILMFSFLNVLSIMAILIYAKILIMRNSSLK